MKKQNENQASLEELSHEQQELLNLIYDEVSDLLAKQIKLASSLDNIEGNEKKSSEVLEQQIENVNRIGSAANMIGLLGLQQFCKLVSDNFAYIKNTKQKLLFSLRSKILYWPDVVQTYLISPSNPDYIQLLLAFIQQKELPLKFAEVDISSLESLFKKSSVEVDSTDEPLRKATPELVDLNISEEVDRELFDSLMHDLPKQTEELSYAVQKLQEQDFLKQLEISERIAHSLKGLGNTVGINGIANLTHHLEGIFSALLKAKKKPVNELHHAIQNAADCLEEMTEHLQGIGPPPEQTVQIFQEILNWTNELSLYGMVDQDDNALNKISTPGEKATSESLNNSSGIKSDEEKIIEPTLQISAHLADDLLKRAGENIISNDQIQELAMQLKKSIQRLNASNKYVRELAQELDSTVEIHGFSSSANSVVEDTEVDPLEIDQFNEIHTFTNQLLESADNSVEFTNEIEEILLKLEKISHGQVRNLRENQEAVLNIRMIPVNSILPRLKRAVRQACKLSGRLAQLEISGNETLIDSEFIHQLADPIMHILRNAIDHGIESPEKRIKDGKDPDGKIQLSFKKEGNLIRVVCQDDGRGLDLERIKLKAEENKLLDKNTNFTKDLAVQTILQQGFTTKDTVSQLSGRGVGLAAMLSKIHEMKGSVSIESEDGLGVRVDIVIPTTFNAVHALIVRCADSKIAISSRGVDEIIFAGAGDITQKEGQHYFQYLQQEYPLYDLQFMLEKTADNVPTKDKISLIINDDAHGKYVVMVDEIYDTREIVTKPLSQYLPRISGIHGTTILGDGSVTAVIDIVELLQTTHARPQYDGPKINTNNLNEPRHHVLIVEDAISTRKLLAQFMRDLGFAVNTAKDGVEAINQIQKQMPTIVLTDLEMPRMNGLELSNHLRTNSETASIPIIMITSKSTVKNKNEAKRLGVNAYITKPYDEDELLTLINSFKLTS